MLKIAIERNKAGHHEVIVGDEVDGSNVECRHILPLVTTAEGQVLLKQIDEVFKQSSKRLNEMRNKVRSGS